MSDTLTARQRVFVEAYLDCLNATEAARRAGYAEPRRQGSRLLTNVDIRTAVDDGLTRRAMSKYEVLGRLAEMGRSDMREFIKFHEETGEVWLDVSPDKPLHLIKEIEITKTTKGGIGEDEVLLDTKIKIKLYDAKSALDTLARHHRIVSSDQPGAVLTITPEQLAQMTDAQLEELARKRNLL